MKNRRKTAAERRDEKEVADMRQQWRLIRNASATERHHLGRHLNNPSPENERYLTAAREDLAAVVSVIHFGTRRN